MSRTSHHDKHGSAVWVYCNGRRGRRQCKGAAELYAAINAGWRLAPVGTRHPQDFCPKCPAPIVPFAKPEKPAPLVFELHRAPGGKTLHPVEAGKDKTMCNRPLPASWTRAEPGAMPMCEVCELQARVAAYRAYRDNREVMFVGPPPSD